MLYKGKHLGWVRFNQTMKVGLQWHDFTLQLFIISFQELDTMRRVSNQAIAILLQ